MRLIPLPLIAPPFVLRIEQHPGIEYPPLKTALVQSILTDKRFTESLVRENALDECGFKGWVFYPGMLFNAKDKWWGDQGKRDKPHEGLDLCLYRDQQDRVFRLDEKTKIPALYDGLVVRIFDDFIGKSVMMEH